MTSRASSVTVAMIAALRFSLFAAAMNASASFARTTTAMRSCDSEIASSVPLRPSYFFGNASRLMSRPGASSPTATATPPAPKSLQRRIEGGERGIAEESLDLAFLDGVSFLHFGAGRGD
jgi:hypothetical protein